MDWRRTERWIIPSLVLAGIFLRIVQLPFSCIWLDEAFSIKLAKEPLIEIVRTLSSDNGSPLFYFLLHGWMQLFGDHEFALTAMTVLLDSAALLAVVFFLRELFTDSRIRIIGVACAAFCLPSLHQATNLRYYSLLVLCTVLSWLSFYRALHHRRNRDGLLFILFSIAGLYTHVVYLFVPFSQFCVLGLFYRRHLRAGLMVFLFLTAGMALWIPSLAMQIAGYMYGGTPETVPELSQYGNMLEAYMLSISAQLLALDSLKLLRITAAALLWFFLLVHLLFRRRRTADDSRAFELFIAHLLSVGVIVLISMSRPIFWLDKTDLIGLPLVCGLAGYAASKLRKISGVVLILFIAVNLAGTVHYTAWRSCGHLTEQREIIKRLAPELTPDDVLIETGISHFTVNYYLDQMRIQTGSRYIFPEEQTTRPSCINQNELLENRGELEKEAAVLMQRLSDIIGRIYVFHSPYSGLDPLYDQLGKTFLLERVIPVRQHPWGPVYTQVDVYCRN